MDYKVSLIVSVLALAAPICVSHSNLIGMKFAQGDYDIGVFDKKSCPSKFAQIIVLSVFGPILFIVVELIE